MKYFLSAISAAFTAAFIALAAVSLLNGDHASLIASTLLQIPAVGCAFGALEAARH